MEFRAAAVLVFIAEHQRALWHAARLLGGYNDSRLVDQCIEQVEKDRVITHRISLMLDQLLALLTLQHSDDPDLQIGFFATIDSSDPAAEKIHLLRDRLRSVLTESQKRREMPPSLV